MNQKSKYWILSLGLGLCLCIGLIIVFPFGSKQSDSSGGLPLPLSSVTPTYAASPSADAKLLHVLNRLSFGLRPGEIEKIKSMGLEAYISSQLTPDSIAQPQSLSQKLNSLETLRLTPVEQRMAIDPNRQSQPGQRRSPEAIKAAQQNGNRIREQAVQGRLLRAIASPRQLEEVMVDFWYNHFNVFVAKTLFVGAYEEQAIRPHVLSKFRQLLGATAKHPAMLTYLDNWLNTAPDSPGVRGRYKGLNENYARELLELHTLGVDGGYTQQDVIALARIFTGWGFPDPRQQARAIGKVAPTDSEFYFDPNRHDSKDKVFLGHTIKGSGMAEGEEALDILARHPATAHHISYKLAQYFVADNPPESLVDKLAKRFLETDGDIRAVLNTLFHSNEFLDPKYYNAKFKTPYQYVISAFRATDSEIKDVRLVRARLRQMGMGIYDCQFPDGYKNTEQAWLNPDAMLRRIDFATALARGQFSGGKPVDAQEVSKTLAPILSAKTNAVMESSDRQTRVALMLGSPEFMKH
jgi:uncharacterized protein (DUF1800 family)